MKPAAESSERAIGPQRWQRIKEILDQVADTPAERRLEAVAGACQGDPDLEREVLSFLEADEEIDEFIEDPLWTLPPKTPPEPDAEASPTTGQRVGPYRIERLVGRGGMGAVFLAIREDDYRKQVALKLVNWGTESEDILSRFYNERQILAQLEHPNIARLLDGGTTADGRPYLVMEYVEGEPIDHYCDAHGLALEDRLRLFREVCAAVHFAHQNLIVHRDLKASNILVTAEGQPRLLDFGIAKLLAPEIATRPVATVPGQVPMTPAYASPEQALGDPVTTATDVYALGVLLYRLLAGRLPFKFEGKKYPEIFRAICYQQPTRPSVAVADETEARGDDEPATWVDRAVTTPNRRAAVSSSASASRRLRRRLAGDLDAIVLKAMRKEPQHRYSSATELSADLRRYLNGLPVKARQGTRLYLLGRYLRRHKLAFVVMLLIAASAVTSTVLWRQAVQQKAHAERQQARAEQQQTRAERVSDFLEELFASADPDRGGDDLRVRQVLELGREKISAELSAEPELQAELLGTLGTVYQRLGILEQARALKEEGLERRRHADSRDRPELAKDLNNLASLLYASGDYEAAEQRFREVLAMQRSLHDEAVTIARTENNLASTLMQRGNYREAEGLFRHVLDIRREHYGEESPRVATSLYSLGALYSNLGEFETAEPLLRQALDIRTAAYGPNDTRVAAVLGSLGWVLSASGDHQQARDCYQRVLAIRLERLGADHPKVATTRKNLAGVLLALGETEAAGGLLDEALPVLRDSPRRDPWELADAEGLLGAFLSRSGRYAEAEALLLPSYLAIRDLRGTSSADTERAVSRLVELYSAWDRPKKAAEYRALLRPRQTP